MSSSSPTLGRVLLAEATPTAEGPVLEQVDPRICNVLDMPWAEFILSTLHVVRPQQGVSCEPSGDTWRCLRLRARAAAVQHPASQFPSLLGEETSLLQARDSNGLRME